MEILQNLKFAEDAFSLSSNEIKKPVVQKIQQEEKVEVVTNPKSKIIKCPYKGIPREIFTSTCLWHRQENDQECFNQKCARVSLKK